jgi:hypothetical protein
MTHHYTALFSESAGKLGTVIFFFGLGHKMLFHIEKRLLFLSEAAIYPLLMLLFLSPLHLFIRFRSRRRFLFYRHGILFFGHEVYLNRKLSVLKIKVRTIYFNLNRQPPHEALGLPVS